MRERNQRHSNAIRGGGGVSTVRRRRRLGSGSSGLELGSGLSLATRSVQVRLQSWFQFSSIRVFTVVERFRFSFSVDSGLGQLSQYRQLWFGSCCQFSDLLQLSQPHHSYTD
ncbi:hypothetical protein HanRHA438_Chr15g0690171 [Helianthus annuus]|uniref:Uncharacterized protein n=1 Tax=Helianthus annuus TaxID=4232 RepID=A0A9K3DXC4_HELAN|nr:hypothetical protein HanXRQr2_Chr15g0677721 [Helianthus annuus]KAJ0829959.1 hypothetical protein HanPSC8_Chr15g0649751 [Helianthus annuus]KAJ0843327.1 hypothetical protein HanRHA438_Chr15g0690171 [Helianthus annuus]